MVLPHCCLSPRRRLWYLIWNLLAINTSYTFSDVITSYVYTTVIIYFPSCDKLCGHFHNTIRISNMMKPKSDVYIISYHCICTKHEITNVRSSQTYWPYKTSEPKCITTTHIFLPMSNYFWKQCDRVTLIFIWCNNVRIFSPCVWSAMWHDIPVFYVCI